MGLVVVGFLVGRFLSTWVVLLAPALVVGLGFIATASMPAGDGQRGLAVYVALLVAVAVGVAEAVGRLVRRHRAGR
jgi:hypothetical protein